MRKEQHHMYVAQTSNNRVIGMHDLYCCLLPQCEALRTCRLGFHIATQWSLIGQIKLPQIATYIQPREFNLLHMLDLLDTNRIKVVRMFDSVRANVDRSLVEQYNMWLLLATPRTTYAANWICCLFFTWHNGLFTKKSELAIRYNTIYHIQSVLDEKTQPDAYIRRTAI